MYIENKEIIKIGPFVFGDEQQWKDAIIPDYKYQITEDQYTDRKLVQIIKPTKKQLKQFQRKFGNYKKSPSLLNITQGRFHTFFPQQLVNFLQKYHGKYSVQSMEDLDFSCNSCKQEFYTKIVQNQLRFNPKILTLFDFCNLAVLKLKGNRITSLEWVMLACNKFQSLLELDLQSNEITNLKPFNKCKLSQLRLLKLQINFLKNVTCIERCLMYSLESIKLDYNLISNFMDLYKCQFYQIDSFTASHNLLKQNEDYRLRMNIFSKKFIKLKNDKFI